MPNPAIVLDSWAVMAFLEDEPAAHQVEAIFIDAVRSGAPLLMTAVNMGEVWYSLSRVHSSSIADDAISRILSIGIKVVSVDWDLSYRAAKLKAEKPVAYADCFAAALAAEEDVELVTGDKEFKRFEDHIKINWLEG